MPRPRPLVPRFCRVEIPMSDAELAQLDGARGQTARAPFIRALIEVEVQAQALRGPRITQRRARRRRS